MALDIEGKIIQIMPATSGMSKAGKEWTKQEFVIETKDQYPRKVMMSVMGDKVNELKKFAVGNEVKASLNIESREYNSRWYTDVRAWKIEGVGSTQNSGGGSNADPFHPDNEPSFTGDNSTDDLPF
jgi:hypothetical protein